ncbi:MAG: DNA repair protein RecO [Chlamydiae bacterium]|nr:DNA repair protein RecO [Chlamydiota bacterium]
MATQQYQVEGIVLHAVPFKEYDKILTLFTPTTGLLKLFFKSSRRFSFVQNALTTPLTVGEYLYSQGRKDLHRFRDGTILHQNLALRNNLETLQTAEKLAHAIYQSQWPGKAAPQLYLLLRTFLEKIPESPHPDTLHTAFLLKILKHEGILQHSPSQEEAYRYGGECFSSNAAPAGAHLFTREEEREFTFLTHSRSFQELSSYELSEELKTKIETLFDQALSS